MDLDAIMEQMSKEYMHNMSALEWVYVWISFLVLASIPEVLIWEVWCRGKRRR